MVLYSKHIILESEEFDGFLELEHGRFRESIKAGKVLMKTTVTV